MKKLLFLAMLLVGLTSFTAKESVVAEENPSNPCFIVTQIDNGDGTMTLIGSVYTGWPDCDGVVVITHTNY